MSEFVLVDFGASRVKYAVFDADRLKLRAGGYLPSPKPLKRGGLLCEESPSALRRAFAEACRKAADACARAPEGVLVSSQMHGFIALDGKGRPLAPYISWRDERSLETRGGESAYGRLERALGARYRAITGMQPRPCYPVFNFAALARSLKLRGRCRLATLPEWLCAAGKDDAGLVHETLFAGLGVYDLGRRRLSEKICDAVADYCGCRPSFGCPVAEITPCASVRLRSRAVPVFTAVGDHQCAVFGAGNLSGRTLSVNVGTGSQVSSPGLVNPACEARPYFGGELMGAITHLPAGRALEQFLGLWGEREQKALWAELGRITPQEALDCPLEFDLALFGSAVGYGGGGSVSRIREGEFTRAQFLRGLVKSMALNYASARARLAGGKLREAVFGGGLSRKIPALPGAFARLTGMKTAVFAGAEETLHGLAGLALHITGRAPAGAREKETKDD